MFTPFVIAAVNKKNNLLVGRFMFYIDDDELKIFSSSFVNNMRGAYLHQLLLERLIQFAHERNVSRITDLSINQSIEDFFTKNNYHCHGDVDITS